MLAIVLLVLAVVWACARRDAPRSHSMTFTIAAIVGLTVVIGLIINNTPG